MSEVDVLPIGWFEELPHGKKGGDQIAKSRDQLPTDRREDVARYLDSGQVLAETLGTQCVDTFAPGSVIGPFRTMTDGFLVWPSDLAYYVRNYGVSVPDAAIVHMRQNGWIVPGMTTTELSRLSDQFIDN